MVANLEITDTEISPLLTQLDDLLGAAGFRRDKFVFDDQAFGNEICDYSGDTFSIKMVQDRGGISIELVPISVRTGGTACVIILEDAFQELGIFIENEVRTMGLIEIAVLITKYKGALGGLIADEKSRKRLEDRKQRRGEESIDEIYASLGVRGRVVACFRKISRSLRRSGN